jgi:hypothetical protein
LVTAWQQAQQDLRVLVLASRGSADPLNPPVPEDPNLRPGPGMPPMGGWMRPAPPGALRGRPMRAARMVAVPAVGPMVGFGSVSYGGSVTSAVPGMPGHEMPREDPLLDLMRLPGGLPDRLVAMVISHWVQLIETGRVPRSATAALTVALDSRASLAVQTWLGSSGIDVDVQMLAPGSAPYLERVDDEAGESIRIGLPFSWLADVWLTGLTHMLGRFTLAADVVDEAVVLDTADTAMSRRTLTLSGVKP